MRTRRTTLCVAGALALAAAGCPRAGSDATLPCTICGDSSGSDAAMPPGTDAGGTPGTDATTQVGGPTITFLSPAEGTTFFAPGVDVDIMIDDPDGVATVDCTANGQPQLVPMSTGPIWTCSVGSMDLTAGPVTVHVSANDLDGAYGENERDFIFDGGPIITFISPDPDTLQTLSGTILIQFTIDPATPVMPGSVIADLNGLPITDLTEGPAGTWTGTFVTDDPTAAVADGVSLITAYATSINGVPASATVSVMLDNTGPEIDFVSPVNGQLVAGLVSIIVDVTDSGGVAGSFVTAQVGFAAPFGLSGPASGGGTFTGTIDTNTLPPTLASTFIEVDAVDDLGNWSSLSVLIEIDNTLPVMELDPSDIRLCDLGDLMVLPQCPGLGGEESLLFDPVGTDALFDGEILGALAGRGQWIPIRAEIRDFGQGPYTNAEAGIADPTVFLYVLDDVSVPLVIDTDGDGLCDVVNPSVVPGGSGPIFALAVPLAPIPPTGSAWYPADPTQPDPIIPFSSMTVVVEDPPVASRPAIYAVGPVVSNGLEDLGNLFDTLVLPDGPACLAVMAEDGIGNVGVSPPLRICIENSSSTACNAFVAPSCTGTLVGSTVTPTPCLPLDFGGAGRSYYTGF